MKRVIVTGASGFIGANALPALLDRQFEVHAIDLPGRPRPSHAGVVWHEIDLMDCAALDRVVEGVAAPYLLHFAWFVRHGEFWTAAENLDWVATSLRLIRAFHRHGGRRAVVAGTFAEYQWSQSRERCIENETPLEPQTLYGVAKNALRAVVESFSATHGMQSAWGRVFLLYGPGEPPARLIPSLIRSLARGERARCRSSNLIRDLLHVTDVGAAFAALLDSDVSGPVNIGSGVPVSLGDVAKAIAAELHAEDRLDLEVEPCSPLVPARLVADTRRLNEEVGFRPRLSLEDGLRLTVQSLAQNL